MLRYCSKVRLFSASGSASEAARYGCLTRSCASPRTSSNVNAVEEAGAVTGGATTTRLAGGATVSVAQTSPASAAQTVARKMGLITVSAGATGSTKPQI